MTDPVTDERLTAAMKRADARTAAVADCGAEVSVEIPLLFVGMDVDGGQLAEVLRLSSLETFALSQLAESTGIGGASLTVLHGGLIRAFLLGFELGVSRGDC